MKTITLKHIEKAIVDISRGQVKHGKATAYAQRSVCGTACCIAGHANQIAGNPMPKESAFFYDLLEKLSNSRDEYKNRLTDILDDPEAKIGSFVKLMRRSGRWKESYYTKPKVKKIKGERS
jgi:hypothetical protein